MAEERATAADPLITAEELKKVKASFSSLGVERKGYSLSYEEFAQLVKHVVKLAEAIGSPQRAAQAAEALAELHE